MSEVSVGLQFVSQKGRRMAINTSVILYVAEPDDLTGPVALVLTNGNVVVVEGESWESLVTRVDAARRGELIPSPVRLYDENGARILPSGVPDRNASRLVVQ